MGECEHGSILIVVLVMITTLLLLGLFLQDHLLIQSRIVQNLYMEMKTYYLSQAGIAYVRNSLKPGFGWTVDNYVIQVNDSEQIRLTVYLDEKGFAVESQGVAKQFQFTSTAHYAPIPPYRRID